MKIEKVNDHQIRLALNGGLLDPVWLMYNESDSR